MDFHVITSVEAQLVMQVIDGQVVIVPPPLPALQRLCGDPTTDAARMVE